MEKIHREPKVTTPDDATDSSSNHDKIKCLQINLNRSEKAWENLILQWLAEEKVDVVFIKNRISTKSATNKLTTAATAATTSPAYQETTGQFITIT
jgi:hypothetical protein